MEYFVIGDEDTVLGFGMAGVNGSVVLNRDEAASTFSEVIGNKNIGIIIITEAVADMIRETVDRYIFTMSFPLIVEIPDRNGHLPNKPDLRELVNRTIGIKL